MGSKSGPPRKPCAQHRATRCYECRSWKAAAHRRKLKGLPPLSWEEYEATVKGKRGTNAAPLVPEEGQTRIVPRRPTRRVVLSQWERWWLEAVFALGRGERVRVERLSLKPVEPRRASEVLRGGD